MGVNIRKYRLPGRTFIVSKVAKKAPCLFSWHGNALHERIGSYVIGRIRIGWKMAMHFTFFIKSRFLATSLLHITIEGKSVLVGLAST